VSANPAIRSASTVRRREERWRIEAIKLDTRWQMGDAAILKPAVGPEHVLDDAGRREREH
jgi:hypothetical protein